MQAYRDVLARSAVRRILVLSLLVRLPMWAANVVLTLHVVTTLHLSYGAAGLLVGVATVAAAISSPWRGRRLDRVGLRGSVLPSLVVGAICWAIAPFVAYWPLLGLAAVADLMMVPSFSIVRQALMYAVDESHRKTALAVDSVAIEITFMVGPAAGVLLASYAPTSWALFGCQFAYLGGALLLWLADPPLRKTDDPATAAALPTVRSWLGPELLAVLAMSAAATLVLTGTEVGVVAALRQMHHQGWIGWELTVWGLGSALGGLLYGALHRSRPVTLLLALLAGATLPIVLAGDPFVFAVLLLVAGFFCAPTITASIEAVSRLVDERVRGEALGWHGSALTAGSAAGAPLAGFAIDRFGWGGGFVLPSVLALALACGGLLTVRTSARRPALPEGAAPAAAQP
ncbi:MAG TPA: MFS transporter [Jatrophihabitans sp.]|nr:MFS transporter [Jatrophihabitans sp.]